MYWLATLNNQPYSVDLGRTRVEIVYHGYSAQLADNQPHRHSSFEVCLVAGGEGNFIVEGRKHPVALNSLFIARPGVRHQIVSTSRPEMELYWIAYQIAQPSNSERGDTEMLIHRFACSPALVVHDDGRCRTLWAALRAIANGGHIEGFSCQLSWITSSLIMAIAQLVVHRDNTSLHQGGEYNPALIRQALWYIDDNLEQPLSPDEVSRHVGLSRRHFSRLFKEHTGHTFIAYINKERINRAIRKLQTTDEPIKDVCLGVGYHDIHYFTRVFTRTVGMPPGEVRRRSV